MSNETELQPAGEEPEGVEIPVAEVAKPKARVIPSGPGIGGGQLTEEEAAAWARKQAAAPGLGR